MAETTMAVISQKEGSPTHNSSFSNSKRRWKASKILSCPTSRTRVKLLKPSNLACLRMMVWVMMNLKFEWSDDRPTSDGCPSSVWQGFLFHLPPTPCTPGLHSCLAIFGMQSWWPHVILLFLHLLMLKIYFNF